MRISTEASKGVLYLFTGRFPCPDNCQRASLLHPSAV